MSEETQSPNWFVRSLLIALVIFLGVLVWFSFFKDTTSFEITPGTVTILALMTLIILSESFNRLSLGKILSLSRDVKRTTTEKEDLKADNIRLRDSLIQVATNIQSQVTTTIQAQGADLRSLLGIKKAEEVEEEEEIKEKEPEVRAPEPSRPSYIYLRPIIEERALIRYFENRNLPQTDLIRRIQFTTIFEGLDPIMESRMIFDGHIKTPQKEYFFEVQLSDRIHLTVWNRYYVQLSKILLYRQAKNIAAEMVIILVKLPHEEEAEKSFMSSYGPARFLQAFQPAISNGLLRVEIMEFSIEEYEELKKETEQSKTAG